MKYLVKYANGESEKVDTIPEAQAKVRGQVGATFRAVAA